MREKRILRLIAAILVCLLLLPCASAFAEESETAAENSGLIDPNALQAILDAYLASHPGLELNDYRQISVGFCYTETGETWVSNPDHWYYSASLYKVPLMMILAKQEHDGLISQDTDLGGLTLATAEDYVLVYSSNPYGHKMMAVVGDGDEAAARPQYKQFSDLPDDYYVDDFYQYSFFTCQFMMDVMEELYFNEELYPHILDCLRRAQNDHYFHAVWGWQYPVAQKYGSYTSPYNGYEYNHTAGVIYTEHPFILVVMTQNMGIGEAYLRDLCKLYGDYSLSLDEKLPAWLEAQAAAAATSEPEPTPEASAEPSSEEEPASVTAEPDNSALPDTQEIKQPEEDRAGSIFLIVIGSVAALAAAFMIGAAAARRKNRVRAGRHQR